MIELSPEAQVYRDALRGDCHLHSTWSDGGATIEEMAATAIALGHEYMVLTDHSPRLTIAHGLNRERLLAQLDDLAVLNERVGAVPHPHRDGGRHPRGRRLDLDDDLLARSTSWSPASTPSCAWSARR